MGQLSFAQTDWLDRGVEFFMSNKPDSAIACWEMVLKTTKEQAPEYGRAMLNLGVGWEAMGDYEMSKKWYKTMLLVDLNELAPPVEEGDQFACYKHNACMRLSTMYALDGDYLNALHYVQRAGKVFPYQTEDGSAFEHRMVDIANWEATFYTKINQPDSALLVLTQKLFDTEIGYRLPAMRMFRIEDYYSGITPTALALVEKQYGRAKFKTLLDQGLENMSIKQDALVTYGEFSVGKLKYRIGTLASSVTKADFQSQIKTTAFYLGLQ